MTRDYRERHSLASQWDYVNIHNNVPHNTAANQNCSFFLFASCFFFFFIISLLSQNNFILNHFDLLLLWKQNLWSGKGQTKSNSTKFSESYQGNVSQKMLYFRKYKKNHTVTSYTIICISIFKKQPIRIKWTVSGPLFRSVHAHTHTKGKLNDITGLLHNVNQS